jgi:cell division protease FtsH
MNHKNRYFIIWITIFAVLFSISQLLPSFSSKSAPRSVAFSDFMTSVNDDHVTEVTIRGDIVHGFFKDGREFATYIPFDPTMVPKLLAKKVRVKAAPMEGDISFLSIFLSWLPFLILMGLSFFSFRQMQATGSKGFGFGKSKAKLMGDKKSNVTFDDVAGVDEAKNELKEVVDFLKDPARFQKLGGKIPKGVLLVGPPGTGKTLLAKAIAGEASVPFFSIAGSDFIEMFVGVGASRVRDMFEQAKKSSPCIIFIDEIDAVGRQRGNGMGGGDDERNQTLNQLLVEMDGFEENGGVIVIAATNRADVLDQALLRPGRFDRHVYVPNPDLNGREKILRVHIKKVPLAKNVDLRIIARGTPGFSGADLANLVNEAALMAARKGKLAVSAEDFERAKDKVLMGSERTSLAMTDEQKKLTAYHEGGHALIAFHLPDSDPIHKATIVPRGGALGMVVRLPEGDQVSITRSKLLADIQVAMGGRLAEIMIFGEDKMTTGASSDIQAATRIARKMITEWGMSKDLTFQNYHTDNSSSHMYGGQESHGHSNKTVEQIDIEITSILNECYAKATTLLNTHMDELHRLAGQLLERETLTGDDIKIILEGGELPDFIEEFTPKHSSIPTLNPNAPADIPNNDITI